MGWWDLEGNYLVQEIVAGRKLVRNEPFNSEVRSEADNVRESTNVFLRGLLDGYKLEMERSRIQRLRIEKEEETKIEWMVRRRVKECERELKKTQEEVMAEKEQTI